MNKILIEFTLLLLKTLHSYMLRAVLVHRQGQLDDGPVRPATRGSSMFLKITLRMR